MEVKLFKLGGHEYVFHLGIIRKGVDKHNFLKSEKRIKTFIDVPKNKYGYDKEDISKSFGLKKYIYFIEHIGEILEVIPEFPQKTTLIIDKLKNIIPDIDASKLNLFARIHESNPLEDNHKQKWFLVSSSWGNSSKIYKKKFVEEKQ